MNFNLETNHQRLENHKDGRAEFVDARLIMKTVSPHQASSGVMVSLPTRKRFLYQLHLEACLDQGEKVFLHISDPIDGKLIVPRIFYLFNRCPVVLSVVFQSTFSLTHLGILTHQADQFHRLVIQRLDIRELCECPVDLDLFHEQSVVVPMIQFKILDQLVENNDLKVNEKKRSVKPAKSEKPIRPERVAEDKLMIIHPKELFIKTDDPIVIADQVVELEDQVISVTKPIHRNVEAEVKVEDHQSDDSLVGSEDEYNQINPQIDREISDHDDQSSEISNLSMEPEEEQIERSSSVSDERPEDDSLSEMVSEELEVDRKLDEGFDDQLNNSGLDSELDDGFEIEEEFDDGEFIEEEIIEGEFDLMHDDVIIENGIANYNYLGKRLLSELNLDSLLSKI